MHSIRNLHDCAVFLFARARWSRDVHVPAPACPEFETPIAVRAPTFLDVRELLVPPTNKP